MVILFMRKRRSGNTMLVGTLIGGVIGATGALLLAPKKGQELRQDIMKQFDQTEREGGKISHMLLEMGSEWTADLFDDNKGEQTESNSQSTSENENQQEQHSNDGGDIGHLIQEVVEDGSNEDQTNNTKE